ncbi:MAG: hypothetical protein EOO68_37145, partial [Moraxellaceae bacterium]
VPLIGVIWTFGTQSFLLLGIISFVCLSSVGFMLWLWFDTGYKISEKELYYRSGPIRGKINITSISHITKNETNYSGLKPALATKGLIIRYGNWKEIYISPERKDEFLNILLQINPAIQIKEVKESINFNKY